MPQTVVEDKDRTYLNLTFENMCVREREERNADVVSNKIESQKGRVADAMQWGPIALLASGLRS